MDYLSIEAWCQEKDINKCTCLKSMKDGLFIYIFVLWRLLNLLVHTFKQY